MIFFPALSEFVGESMEGDQLVKLIEDARNIVEIGKDDYVVIIDSLLVAQMFEQGMDLFIQALKRGVPPSESIFMSLFRGCLGRGKPRVAKNLYLEAAKSGMALHEASISYIRTELRRAGFKVSDLMKNQVVATQANPEDL